MLHKVLEKASSAPSDNRVKLRLVSSPLMPNFSKVRDVPFSWEDVKQIVAKNDLEAFARSESTTNKYLQFKSELKAKQVSVFKVMLTRQLEWFDRKLNGDRDIEQIPDSEIKFCAKSDRLFGHENDLKVLPNDFAYYFEDNVTHLCVWSKLQIPSDPNSPLGDVSDSTRRLITRYVEKTFVQGLGIPPENVVWFRNWDALQSVKAISHIHVVIKDLSPQQQQAILYTAGSILDNDDYARLK